MITAAAAGRRSRGAWWHILLIGLALFVVGVLVFALTSNLNLFPTVALIGNFLVPVGYVAFFYERRHMSQVTLVSIVRAFFYGGVLGVFAAALREPIFIRLLTLESPQLAARAAHAPGATTSCGWSACSGVCSIGCQVGHPVPTRSPRDLHATAAFRRA